jgi:7-keto-8-aminopelargonate synthetase-like enzyme
MLDEAHAVGAVGPEGRGIAAERGVVPDLVVGTFGKALGSFGAFVATTRSIADLLWNRARSLVFSTAAPPGVSAVSRAALAIVRGAEGDRRRVDLAAHARRLRELVRDAGGAPTSAIVPLVIGSDPDVMARTELLLAEGVFVQGIRPPTVPVGTARLRIGLSAAHTVQQVEILAKLLMTHRVSRTPHG